MFSYNEAVIKNRVVAGTVTCRHRTESCAST